MKANEMIDLIQQALHIEPERIQIIERLIGGMSHLTYHITIDSEPHTVRIIGKDGNKFVDRKIEYQNIMIIDCLNINHQMVFFDQNTGLKIAKYIKGDVLSQTDYKPLLPHVVKTLKKLHHSQLIPVNDYGFKARLALYESYLEDLNPTYLSLKEKWFELYEHVFQFQPKVFCHNDAQQSNMVFANNQMYLLDWEYAGLNPFYYDIASFGNLSFDHAIELLEAYLGYPPEAYDINSVIYYRMFQALQWHLVAAYKDRIHLSDVLKFDFNALAKKYIDLAQTLFNRLKETTWNT